MAGREATAAADQPGERPQDLGRRHGGQVQDDPGGGSDGEGDHEGAAHWQRGCLQSGRRDGGAAGEAGGGEPLQQ